MQHCDAGIVVHIKADKLRIKLFLTMQQCAYKILKKIMRLGVIRDTCQPC